MAYDLEKHTAQLAGEHFRSLELSRRQRFESRQDATRQPGTRQHSTQDELITSLVDHELKEHPDEVRDYQRDYKPYLSLWDCAREIVCAREPGRYELYRRESNGDVVTPRHESTPNTGQRTTTRVVVATPEERMFQLAAAKMEADPRINELDAIAIVARENPELYRLANLPATADVGFERTAGYDVTPRKTAHIAQAGVGSKPDARGRVNTPSTGEGDVTGRPTTRRIDEGVGASSPTQQFNAKVKELMDREGIDQVTATAAIAMRHPDLYLRSQRAQSVPIHSAKPMAPGVGGDSDDE